MDWVDEMVASGHDVKAQVAPRPIGVLIGLTATANPFLFCASYSEIAALDLSERIRAMSEPQRRRQILAEHTALLQNLEPGILAQIVGGFDVMFQLTDPVDYEMNTDRSLAAQAAAGAMDPGELLYDTLLEDNGTRLVYLPLFNFAAGNLDAVADMIAAPNSLFGLSDAGAHCGAICDASMPTSAITLWSRDRRDGERMPLETIVHNQTRRTAEHLGWFDRGLVAPGHVADLNLIDLDALGCHPPTIVKDLPAGGRRLMQTAQGYRYTIKSGSITVVDGALTGELPGSLVRGTRPSP